MKFSTSRRMKLKCSGQSCNHMYEYTDTEDCLCNGPGRHKSHAKFYAGVYDDYVEVIVGSYNLHSSSYCENMMLRRYEPEQFSRSYLAPFNVSLHRPAHNRAQSVFKAVIEIDAGKGVMPARLE